MLNSNLKKMLELANAALKNAYVPYSNFQVACCLLADDGKFYSSCNVENASLPVGLCAEAGACSALIAGGSKKIKEALIIAEKSGFCTPCGACRQRLFELAVPNMVIHFCSKNGDNLRNYTIEELLPFGFRLEIKEDK